MDDIKSLRREARSIPQFFTEAEVLADLASMINKRAQDYKLVKQMLDMMPPQVKNEANSIVPEIDLQLSAMEAAYKTVNDLANEKKILAAKGLS